MQECVYVCIDVLFQITAKYWEFDNKDEKDVYHF